MIKFNSGVFRQIMAFAERDTWPALFWCYCALFKRPRSIHIVDALKMGDIFTIKYAALSCDAIFTKKIITYGNQHIIEFIWNKIPQDYLPLVYLLANITLADKVTRTKNIPYYINNSVISGDINFMEYVRHKYKIEISDFAVAASKIDNLNTFKYTCENGFAINHHVMSVAAMCGSLNVLEYCIQSVQPNIEILEDAIEYGHYDCIKLLVKYVPPILIYSLRLGDITDVRIIDLIIPNYINVNMLFKSACLHGNKYIIRATHSYVRGTNMDIECHDKNIFKYLLKHNLINMHSAAKHVCKFNYIKFIKAHPEYNEIVFDSAIYINFKIFKMLLPHVKNIDVYNICKNHKRVKYMVRHGYAAMFHRYLDDTPNELKSYIIKHTSDISFCENVLHKSIISRDRNLLKHVVRKLPIKYVCATFEHEVLDLLPKKYMRKMCRYYENHGKTEMVAKCEKLLFKI